MEAEICAALCAPQIPIKDYSAVIGELAHFLPSHTSSSGFAALVPLVVLFWEAAEGCKDLNPPPPPTPLILSDAPGKVGLHVGSAVLLLQ